MTSRHCVLVALSSLTVLFAHIPANAYYVQSRATVTEDGATPEPVKWPLESGPYEYRVATDTFPEGPSQEDVAAAIRNAFNTWSSVECVALKFNDSGTRLPSSDKTPSENAMSVAAGIAQPLVATGSPQVIHA